tara:strand:+ start:368 stop:1291 length:924 start_codon:yes stop_codon:yes gene_type:complete
MPRHISIVFPGQGSQKLGMLNNLPIDLVNNYKNQAADVLGFDLVDMINNGNNDELNKTSITQPAILFTSFIYYKYLSELFDFKPDLLCGHSLGEYTALLVSNVITLKEALSLVHTRGLLMENAKSGSMYALLNIDFEIVKDSCSKISNETNLIVSPANINSPNQIVISGNTKAVELVINKLKTEGFKKIIKLNITVPSHCELMNEASNSFAEVLNELNLNLPKIKIVHNVNSNISKNIDELKSNLINQLTQPVQWIKTMNYIKKFNGIIIECGPGKVLSGLAKANNITKYIYSSSSINFSEDIKEVI